MLYSRMRRPFLICSSQVPLLLLSLACPPHSPWGFLRSHSCKGAGQEASSVACSLSGLLWFLETEWCPRRFLRSCPSFSLYFSLPCNSHCRRSRKRGLPPPGSRRAGFLVTCSPVLSPLGLSCHSWVLVPVVCWTPAEVVMPRGSGHMLFFFFFFFTVVQHCAWHHMNDKFMDADVGISSGFLKKTEERCEEG